MPFILLLLLMTFFLAKLFTPTSPTAMMVVQLRAARQAEKAGR